jgi:hypothetical protein
MGSCGNLTLGGRFGPSWMEPRFVPDEEGIRLGGGIWNVEGNCTLPDRVNLIPAGTEQIFGLSSEADDVKLEILILVVAGDSCICWLRTLP